MNNNLKFTIPSQKVLEEYGIGDFSFVESSVAISYKKFLSWVEQEKGKGLAYLLDKRKEIRSSLLNVFPEFQTALVVLFPYKKFQEGENGLKIADYVWGFHGNDYHLYLYERLEKFVKSQFKEQVFNYKISIDTLPILERDLAYRAGLGWFGKNSLLINRCLGSYFIITSVLLDKKIELVSHSESILNFTFVRSTESDHCGTCNRCEVSCPTQAIDVEQRFVDAQKCISTYTVENFSGKKTPPSGYEITTDIFGCDICQRVCPWNSKVELVSRDKTTPHKLDEFFYKQTLEEIIDKLSLMSKRKFQREFSNTSLQRTGRDSIIKNIQDKI